MKSIIDIDISFLFSNPQLYFKRDICAQRPGYFIDERNEEEVSLAYKLEGVFLDGKDSFAFIDGREYRVGYYIDDYLVKDIGKNFVVLKKNNTVKELVIKNREMFNKRTDALDVNVSQSVKGEGLNNEKKY